MPYSSPCITSRGSVIHPICHSATRMKKTTNLAKKINPIFRINFRDLDYMFLRVCILVFVALDTAVESASESLLIVCTSDSSMRRRLCSGVEEPMDHCMLDHSSVESTLFCIVRALLTWPYKYHLLELRHLFLCTELPSNPTFVEPQGIWRL